MPLSLPDSWPQSILAIKLDRPVHPDAGDFALRAPDRLSRSQGFRRLFRKFAADVELTVREHPNPFISPMETPPNSRPVRFIEPPDCPWGIAAGWTFPDPSEQLNTASLEISLRHAFPGNWVATVRINGQVLCTLMKREYMAWLGMPEEDFPLFEGDPAKLAHVFDRSPGEIRAALNRALGSPGEEHGSDVVAAGTLMSDLGVWPETWREYFRRGPGGPSSEILLVGDF